jgi:hypothetical protein
VASAPFGKNEELLFSCTDVSLPKSGPKMPTMRNQMMTTSMASANGLRDLVDALIDIVELRPFGLKYCGNSLEGKPTFRLSP